MLLTSIFHLSSESKIRSCKPLVSYPYDSSLLRANVVIYLLFIVCWTPLMVATGLSASGPNNSAEDVVAASDDSSSLSTRSLPLRIFQQLQWLAMAKSCLNPFIYALCSKHYREAFVSLFHYCCCKTSVSFSRRVMLCCSKRSVWHFDWFLSHHKEEFTWKTISLCHESHYFETLT